MRTVTIINLTANPVIMYDPTGTEVLVTFPKFTLCGIKAKMTTKTEEWVQIKLDDDTLERVHLTKTVFSKEAPLPPPAPDTLYIVSEVVARVYRERDDLRICDKLIKREGKTVGCRSLGKI